MNSHAKAMLRTAMAWKQESTCVRLQVGAVITDSSNRVLSIGYNGSLSGRPHCSEYFSKCNGSFYIKKKLPVPILDRDIINTYDTEYKVSEATWRKIHHEFALRYEVHAEMNALINLVKTGTSVGEDVILYTTTVPCDNCLKHMAQLGIRHVFYKDDYDNADYDILAIARRHSIKLIKMGV